MFGKSKLMPAFLALALIPVLTFGQRQAPKAAPDRGEQGDGPFERLIIRGAYMIDGTGAPPQGPVDIVIEGTRSPAFKRWAPPRSPSTTSAVPRMRPK